MKFYGWILVAGTCLYFMPDIFALESTEAKKEQVLDFSAGVIEGELTPPSILMELGSNFKDFNDLIVLREDFNKYHQQDSAVRLRYIEDTQ